MPASEKKLRTEWQENKLGYRPVMGPVARAEGQVVFRGGRRDQGIGHAQAGRKPVFFHVDDGPVTGVLGQGQCPEAEVAAGVVRKSTNLHGNLLYDAQIAILMREHGIKRIYTRDTDFHRFSFLEPIDPTA